MNLKDVQLGSELTQTNAVQWFQQMEILLRSLECWSAVASDVGDAAHRMQPDLLFNAMLEMI